MHLDAMNIVHMYQLRLSKTCKEINPAKNPLINALYPSFLCLKCRNKHRLALMIPVIDAKNIGSLQFSSVKNSFFKD